MKETEEQKLKGETKTSFACPMPREINRFRATQKLCRRVGEEEGEQT